MAPEFLALTLVATSIVTALAMLSLGSWLIRNDRNRGTGLMARLIEDIRWLQDLVVDFFGRTRLCRDALSILATHQTPVMANELMQKVTADAQPLALEWAALGIMRLGGLVRFTRDGVLATNVGREVYQRISSPPPSRDAYKFRPPSIYGSLFVPVPVHTGTRSHLERVGEALERRAPGTNSVEYRGRYDWHRTIARPISKDG